MTTDEGIQIWEPTDEPNWALISQKYSDLARITSQLQKDIHDYKAALSQLDGLGTSIGNGQERISMLREEIARMEAKQ